MIQVAYTNSNCIDLWEIFQKQTIKHCNIPLYLISDAKPKNFGFTDSHIYNNDEPYYKVWIDALKKFDSEYFIYLQEDFFLYDDVNEKKLNEYLEFLKSNKEYSFVRLIKSGNLKNKKITDTLFEIESSNQDIFSMQSTIWRTEDYIRLLDYVKDSKWLENERYRNASIFLNIKGLYHYDNEPKRGGAHYDTNVYPYIATALVKGKWNLSEYEKELGDILKVNNIDINKRGKF
jgi:hypothetical protein